MNRKRKTGTFVTVARFGQPVDAHLARTRLESDGIPAFVGDEHVVQVNWLLSNAVGGVKLRVPTEFETAARDALRPRPQLVVAADDDLVCPRCRAVDVYHDPVAARVANVAGALAVVISAIFGPVWPRSSRRWICRRCGYEWKDRLTDLPDGSGT